MFPFLLALIAIVIQFQKNPHVDIITFEDITPTYNKCHHVTHGEKQHTLPLALATWLLTWTVMQDAAPWLY